MQSDEQNEADIGWELICKARKDESVRRNLKKELTPWVAQIAEEYIEKEMLAKKPAGRNWLRQGFQNLKLL